MVNGCLTYFWKHGILTYKRNRMVGLVDNVDFVLDLIGLVAGVEVDLLEFCLGRSDLILCLVFVRKVFFYEAATPQIQGDRGRGVSGSFCNKLIQFPEIPGPKNGCMIAYVIINEKKLYTRCVAFTSINRICYFICLILLRKKNNFHN